MQHGRRVGAYRRLQWNCPDRFIRSVRRFKTYPLRGGAGSKPMTTMTARDYPPNSNIGGLGELAALRRSSSSEYFASSPYTPPPPSRKVPINPIIFGVPFNRDEIKICASALVRDEHLWRDFKSVLDKSGASNPLLVKVELLKYLARNVSPEGEGEGEGATSHAPSWGIRVRRGGEGSDDAGGGRAGGADLKSSFTSLTRAISSPNLVDFVRGVVSEKGRSDIAPPHHKVGSDSEFLSDNRNNNNNSSSIGSGKSMNRGHNTAGNLQRLTAGILSGIKGGRGGNRAEVGNSASLRREGGRGFSHSSCNGEWVFLPKSSRPLSQPTTGGENEDSVMEKGVAGSSGVIFYPKKLKEDVTNDNMSDGNWSRSADPENDQDDSTSCAAESSTAAQQREAEELFASSPHLPWSPMTAEEHPKLRGARTRMSSVRESVITEFPAAEEEEEKEGRDEGSRDMNLLWNRNTDHKGHHFPRTVKNVTSSVITVAGS